MNDLVNKGMGFCLVQVGKKRIGLLNLKYKEFHIICLVLSFIPSQRALTLLRLMMLVCDIVLFLLIVPCGHIGNSQ